MILIIKNFKKNLSFEKFEVRQSIIISKLCITQILFKVEGVLLRIQTYIYYFTDPPVQGASPSYQDGDVARKMGLNVSPKYKGFYRYGAN